MNRAPQHLTDRTCREALAYQEMGLSVIPIIAHTKRPPERFKLSGYFDQAATETEVCRWFGAGPTNMAVCLGDVSDGLTCRDFDRQSSYERWSTLHPRLASVLPTVRTARGAHVYCTSDRSDFDGRSIIVGDDGELKRGGYTLLPPSIHPTGVRYEWVTSLESAPHISDLLLAGLLPKNVSATQDIEGPLGGEIGFEGLTVQQAIEASQPCGHGERHYCIFTFARMLKATDLADASQAELKSVFARWLTLARPRIKTKIWRINWLDFLDAWSHVRRPYGATIQAIASRATGEGIERLESICRELQRVAGEQPFFLSCRVAASLLDVNQGTISRWFKKLCDGPLICVDRGDRMQRRAAQYMFRKHH